MENASNFKHVESVECSCRGEGEVLLLSRKKLSSVRVAGNVLIWFYSSSYFSEAGLANLGAHRCSALRGEKKILKRTWPLSPSYRERCSKWSLCCLKPINFILFFCKLHSDFMQYAHMCTNAHTFGRRVINGGALMEPHTALLGTATSAHPTALNVVSEWHGLKSTHI